VEVYELLRAGPVRSRLQAAVARGLTRFVGRDGELKQLRQALVRAGAGQGQVLAGVGEAGVGKSRLLYEFTRSHHTHGWLLLASTSVSYGKATAYLPVLDLLKGYFEIEPQDDARRLREKVTGKLLTLDRVLEPMLPAFLALLEVPVEDPQWHAFDPPQRRRRTLEAIKHLLLRESQVQPLCLVFEDLHWIDAETQALLDSLVESLPTARLLLLVNYRPEYQHGWGSKTFYTQLRLDPLPPASADEFLQALLGDDPSLAPLKQLLIARTQGNPFFLEESVRTLVETGVLVGEPGVYRLAHALPTVQVPATVQAVLAARIDRLPPEEKRLLQTAAVIGTEVPWPLLQAIADEPEEALHCGLARLQAAEFLYETSLFPEHVYTFKHALTHEVAYQGLLQERRRALHTQIVEVLEALAGDRLVDQVERLAHHGLRGEVWDKALAYCRQAGEKALGRSAHREAVAAFEQALSALPHLPDQRTTREQAIDLRLALRTALRPLGEFGCILTYLREAETLAAALDDTRRLGQIAVFLSNHFYWMGAYDDAIAAGQRTLTLALANRDVVQHALANLRLGIAYWSQGDYRRASECLRQTVAALDGSRRYEQFGQVLVPAVHARGMLLWCCAELGTFAEGRALGAEGLQIAEVVAHSGSLMYAYAGVGWLSLCQGDLHTALPFLEHAMRLCHEADFPAYFPRMAAALGAAYSLGGRVADALPLLRQALEQLTAMTRPHLEAPCSLPLSEAYLLDGRFEEAQALAERALTRAHEHQERGN
jgi:predicted ATPase